MDRSLSLEVPGCLGAKGRRHTCETDKSTAQVHIQHLVENAHLISFEHLVLSDTKVMSKMGTM